MKYVKQNSLKLTGAVVVPVALGYSSSWPSAHYGHVGPKYSGRWSTLADASTTSTVYTTSFTGVTTTSTTTVTSTMTTTSTSYTPSSTTYAVCEDSSNYLSYVAGNPISVVSPLFAYSDTTAVTNAHDCCVLCQSTPGCGVSVWEGAYNPPTCYLVDDNGTCDPTEEVASFETNPGYEPPSISNGNCGQDVYAGAGS